MERIIPNNVTTVEVISLDMLMGMLSTKKGAQFATIISLTDARLLKTNNPFGQVFKRSRVNVCINFNYGNSVNRQRNREGESPDFEPKPRKWGTRLPSLPFVTHKGKVYLETKVERSLSHEYVSNDGIVLTSEQVAPYIPDKKSNADHQGVEKEIIIRDYTIDTIEEIVIGGQRYKVDNATVSSIHVSA